MIDSIPATGPRDRHARGISILVRLVPCPRLCAPDQAAAALLAGLRERAVPVIHFVTEFAIRRDRRPSFGRPPTMIPRRPAAHLVHNPPAARSDHPRAVGPAISSCAARSLSSFHGTDLEFSAPLGVNTVLLAASLRHLRLCASFEATTRLRVVIATSRDSLDGGDAPLRAHAHGRGHRWPLATTVLPVARHMSTPSIFAMRRSCARYLDRRRDRRASCSPSIRQVSQKCRHGRAHLPETGPLAPTERMSTACLFFEEQGAFRGGPRGQAHHRGRRGLAPPVSSRASSWKAGHSSLDGPLSAECYPSRPTWTQRKSDHLPIVSQRHHPAQAEPVNVRTGGPAPAVAPFGKWAYENRDTVRSR